MKKKNHVTVGFTVDRKNFLELQRMRDTLPSQYATGVRFPFSDFLRLLVTLGAGELKKQIQLVEKP